VGCQLHRTDTCEQANDTRSMPQNQFQEHNNKNPISTDFLATDQIDYSKIAPSLYQLPVISCNLLQTI
jgi:hypothetical protein